MVGPGSLLRVGAGPAADTLAAAKLRSFRAGVFSADSRLIALTTLSGPSDRAHRAAVVEVATGATVRELPLRSNANLAFHPDGRSLAAADCDGLAFLDLATGREFARRKAHAPHPEHAHLPFARVLLYFPDGSRLVTGHADTTALVWDAPRRPVAVTGPDEGARAAAWDDLASADGAKGWSAVWAPADDPGGTGFLRGRVRPAEPLPGKEFDALLGDLDGDDFATRSAAARKLEAAGERAVGQLRGALGRDLSAEQRAAVGRLIGAWEAADRRPPAGERLRVMRAVAALELSGTADARKVLAGLAAGPADAVATREAAAALPRLGGGG